MIIIGLDWGRNKHAYVVINSSNQPIKRGECPNRTASFASWADEIESIDSDIVVGLESGNGLAFPLEQFCGTRGWRVQHVSAAAVKSYRENVMGKTRKTDELDCLAIAALVAGEASAVAEKRFDRDALRRATRDRGALTADKTRLSNRLRQLVAELCPELTVERIPNICAAGLLHLLTLHPDPESWAELGVGGVSSLLKQSGIRSRSEFIAKLVAIAEGFKPVVIGMNREVLLTEIKMVARRLRHCVEDIVTADEFLEQLSESDAAVQAIRAIPGAGAVLAPAIVAEIRDIRNFPSDANLASYAGMALRQHQTGKSANYWTPQLRSNRRLKHLMLQFAMANAKFSPISAAYFERKLRSKKPLQARRALARQLVRVVFKTLRSLPS